MTSKTLVKPNGTILNQYKKAIYLAFKTDAVLFLQQFEKDNTLNYADFASLWQTRSFTFIFADETNVRSLKILCEICFITAIKCIISDSSLNIKIGAFYLLYGLYYKQPIRDMVKIRLTLREFRSIKELMNEMLSKGQYDALYIYAKMKSDGAFLFVAHPRFLNVAVRSNTIDIDQDNIFETRGPEGSLQKFECMMDDDTIKELSKTCNEYEAKLMSFSRHNLSLTPFKSTVMTDLKEHYEKVFASKSTVSDENLSTEQTVWKTRHEIRLKALASKNAEYRGSRKVITAVDSNDSSESD